MEKYCNCSNISPYFFSDVNKCQGIGHIEYNKLKELEPREINYTTVDNIKHTFKNIAEFKQWKNKN